MADRVCESRQQSPLRDNYRMGRRCFERRGGGGRRDAKRRLQNVAAILRRALFGHV